MLIYTYMYMYVNIHVYICIYTYVCICMYMYACICNYVPSDAEVLIIGSLVSGCAPFTLAVWNNECAHRDFGLVPRNAWPCAYVLPSSFVNPQGGGSGIKFRGGTCAFQSGRLPPICAFPPPSRAH